MFNVCEVMNLSIQNNVTKYRGTCLKNYVKIAWKNFSLVFNSKGFIVFI